MGSRHPKLRYDAPYGDTAPIPMSATTSVSTAATYHHQSTRHPQPSQRSRPTTPCSAVTATAVGSEQSHDVGSGPQTWAPSTIPQKPHVPNPEPRPTGPPIKKSCNGSEDSHGSVCCIVM